MSTNRSTVVEKSPEATFIGVVIGLVIFMAIGVAFFVLLRVVLGAAFDVASAVSLVLWFGYSVKNFFRLNMYSPDEEKMTWRAYLVKKFKVSGDGKEGDELAHYQAGKIATWFNLTYIANFMIVLFLAGFAFNVNYQVAWVPFLSVAALVFGYISATSKYNFDRKVGLKELDEKVHEDTKLHRLGNLLARWTMLFYAVALIAVRFGLIK